MTHCEDVWDAICDAVEAFIPASASLTTLPKLVMDGAFTSDADDRTTICHRLAALLRCAELASLELTIRDGAELPLNTDGTERKWGMDEDIVWTECRHHKLKMRRAYRVLHVADLERLAASIGV